ncbi:MAG: phosphoenolpyruvate carboxykinase (ATP) [Candidatus Magasanikbacteria bacterium]|nr:phosphoenolpyruvate carboxykinase (ATP) [Candidatus Magasanikbacteria bacterium]|tara:strand:+ start:1166 stop:2773 length:1608 start_codon:yes stop_codon:yes gene_type:complete
MNELHRRLDTLANEKGLKEDSRELLIIRSLAGQELLLTQCGALARTAPDHSRGRNPKATYIVSGGESQEYIDWESPTNNPMNRSTFDAVLENMVRRLESLRNVVVVDRMIGAEDECAIPVRVITNKTSVGLFADNMFRKVTAESCVSTLRNKRLVILVLPDNELHVPEFGGNMVIATDMNRGVGVVSGCAYYGAIKKMAFTYANYWLPHFGILPMHCGANMGKDGDTTLFLGLSGTGKTTLSTDVHRPIIGDDEHAWMENGIFNLEGGCYAKLAHLSKEKEPGIWHAFHRSGSHTENGAIIENAKMDKNGVLDFADTSLTENARVSFPLSHLGNVEQSGKGGHPNSVIFLTADANGVLPPVAKLNHDQALLWFLLGYTSKLAGTETDITTPKSTFSRFFGAPFMPHSSKVYLDLFSKQIKEYKTQVYLVNTGWSGGPFGVGNRMDIAVSRAIINAVVSGLLNEVEYRIDERFKFSVPITCPGVSEKVLDPRNTWDDPLVYDSVANELADEFTHQLETFSGQDIYSSILAVCPSPC